MEKIINIVELAFFFLLTIATGAAFIGFAALFCSVGMAVFTTALVIPLSGLVTYEKLTEEN